jgi:hypothetical protein
MPPAKKAKKKSKKQPTVEGLTKQVEKLREWVMVLKDLHGLGSWSYRKYVNLKGRPNSSGGPPPYPGS